MLRRDQRDVVSGAGDLQIRYPKWLSINSSVGLARKKLSEGGRIDVRSGQGKLMSICAVAGEVVVIGENAGEIGDANGD